MTARLLSGRGLCRPLRVGFRVWPVLPSASPALERLRRVRRPVAAGLMYDASMLLLFYVPQFLDVTVASMSL
jgi:hypothetical protein